MGWTSSITIRSMVGRDPVSHAGCRRKSVMFFVCLFVTLWNDEVCDNGNAMKQYKFQNNNGVIAWRKVCSCAPMFKFFLSTPIFFPEGQMFTKNNNFWRFLEPYGHIFKATMVKFGMRVRSWDSLPRQNFVKMT